MLHLRLNEYERNVIAGVVEDDMETNWDDFLLDHMPDEMPVEDVVKATEDGVAGVTEYLHRTRLGKAKLHTKDEYREPIAKAWVEYLDTLGEGMFERWSFEEMVNRPKVDDKRREKIKRIHAAVLAMIRGEE